MKISVLVVNISCTDYFTAAKQIYQFAKDGNNHYVCAANVHMVMEAWDDPSFRELVNAADLVTPDGMPLVWALRLKGERKQQRVYGPTLMLYVLEMAAREQIPVGFYGGKEDVLNELVKRMLDAYPGLNITYAYSPPFRSLSVEEDDEICRQIRDSDSRILFVGLGCPKQERWMYEHREGISAVMLGVGAAFDFHAGAVSQAPSWMQRFGLEWLYRLGQEPRRLCRRYLYNNPRFLFLVMAELLGLIATERG